MGGLICEKGCTSTICIPIKSSLDYKCYSQGSKWFGRPGLDSALDLILCVDGHPTFELRIYTYI